MLASSILPGWSLGTWKVFYLLKIYLLWKIWPIFVKRWKPVWIRACTYDLSMKARTKCHIAIRLYKIAEVHLTTTTKKISFTNAVLLSFVIIVPIVGKTWCVMMCHGSSCLLSYACSFTITAPGISFGVNLYSLNDKSMLFTVLEVCWKSGGA